MRARGLPVPEPHSLLYGHIPLMKSLKENLPKDAHDTYVHRKLTMNWQKYFPRQKECPPTSPDTCFQLIQQTAQPRHSMFSLNPGFSLKNLPSQTPIMIEEVDIFAQQLKEQAGQDGTFGDLYNLFDRTVALTFDIITRVSLDLRVREQTQGPTPILKALRALVGHILRTNLLPQIKSRLQPDASSEKTVIDLAVKEYKSESGNKNRQPSPDFIDTVISQLKLFMLAGHDTTAQAICWVLYEITNGGPFQSLRLHPLGSTHRRGSRGFSFVCDGTTYPTDDSVIWTSPTAVHLRADLWPQVMEFLPERFLVAEGHPLHPVKNAWRPFELGNTRCIGEELAMIEMKLVLALTMRELDFCFDWKGWNTLQRRTAPPDSVDGEHIYRVGNGIGSVKDKLPTRIKLR
ncbi:cytochrome P450 [Hypoxylon fuscum]|nr:cytochrome P450 [Hypoxylon fuscum]